MARSLTLVLTLLFVSSTVYSLTVEGIALLISGEKKEVSISGFRKGLFAPFSKVRTADNQEVELSLISSIKVPSENLEFVVFKVLIFEDESYLLATPLSSNLYKTKASYRPCTCNKGFRTAIAYVHLTEKSKNIILKRVFSDKVIKKNGEYTGLTEKLEKALEPLNYSFSSIPGLISNGIN